MGGGNGAKEASCHTCKQAAVTETGIESICYKTAQLTGPPMQSLQRREQQGQHGTVLAGVKLLRKITRSHCAEGKCCPQLSGVN